MKKKKRDEAGSLLSREQNESFYSDTALIWWSGERPTAGTWWTTKLSASQRPPHASAGMVAASLHAAEGPDPVIVNTLLTAARAGVISIAPRAVVSHAMCTVCSNLLKRFASLEDQYQREALFSLLVMSPERYWRGESGLNCSCPWVAW